ncbi:unnamed protein product [Protopolystoma xenopodis]|uniref:Uncharacterized protein n=1 Tax=Protopolystoma xenopodis TaxID=117903 RepID=A0A3S5BQ51_9PLAT|nr:unnamed protein product [Protopolystoma xenopodis]
MVLRMARLTDYAEYDAGETSEKVQRPRSDFGNDQADNGLQTRLKEVDNCELLQLYFCGGKKNQVASV